MTAPRLTIAVVHRASALPIDLVLAGPGLEQLFLEELHIEKIGRREMCSCPWRISS